MLLPRSNASLVSILFAAAACLSSPMAGAQGVPDSVSQIFLRTNALHENDTVNISGNGSIPIWYRSFSTDSDSLESPPGSTIGVTTISARAQAEVTRKSIGVYTLATASGASAQTFYYGTGAFGQLTTSIRNYFQIDHPALTGQTGTIVARLEVNGAVTLAGSANAPGYTDAESNVYVWATGLAPVHNNCSNGAPLCDSQYANSLGPNSQEGGATSGTRILRIPFVFGNVGSVDMAVWAFSEATAVGYNNEAGAVAESNFYSGVRWGGITEILDANGNPVQGWTISSPADLELPAPEPGLAAMIAAGSIALAGAGNRTRRRAAR